MKMHADWAPLLLATFALAAGAHTPANIESAADNWPTPGGDANKSHHSQLTDLTPGNVAGLGLAWTANLGTHHPERHIAVLRHVLFRNRLPETRPSGMGLEFGVG